MARPLTVEQEARILTCREAHEATIEQCLQDLPGPLDRMPDRLVLENAVRSTRAPVPLIIAWLDRLITDRTARCLDADLDVSLPRNPDLDDVALIVDLAVDERCWYYEVRLALLLAERCIEHGPVSVSLVDGLLALRTRIDNDRMHSSEFFRAKTLPWILRLVAATSPPQSVDLGFLDGHDNWAPEVIAVVAGSTDGAGIARALLHLGAPRGSRPSKAWWAKTADLFAANDELGSVAEAILEAVVAVDATPRSDERDGWDVPDPFLLTPTNELVARGVAWGLRHGVSTPSRIEVLGRVALRSAAMVWVPPAHRMLCPKLASASIDTLIALESTASRRELEGLLGELRNPTLIRRVGTHLGTDVDEIVTGLRRRGPLPRPDR